MGSSRGTGPWPSSNDEQAVSLWLKSRISVGVEDEERAPVVRLCLEYVSKMERGERLMNNYRFPESEIDRLAVMADRLSKGEPVQYIMGTAHFDGHNYNVDSRVLIPRPETEELVFSIVEKLKDSEIKGFVLDIGTGSGCIALAIKKRLPEWGVFASDFSEEAIEVAKELLNGRQNKDTIKFTDDSEPKSNAFHDFYNKTKSDRIENNKKFLKGCFSGIGIVSFVTLVIVTIAIIWTVNSCNGVIDLSFFKAGWH